ncbi:TonB-dependent hemoglobin/transferrin/lactoferrin family receptor [Castellaniella hirudinis]|uniref:TonB-dependent hemoglobin/transferrin/lactoferrin family receptor n=1 Tax=Castellaniella hirudinis TaxID=1144617 RepID=A0ABV8RUV8_9BURK
MARRIGMGICLALVAPVGLAQTPSGPQASPEVQTLSPLRVEGQADGALPPGSSVIAKEALEQRGIDSWEDFARRGDPGVGFSRETNSINVRGQDGDRVVTRVDGIRIPWLNDGARGEKGGLNTIDFNTLSSIDLVRGAAGAQSGALAGYLDLRTLAPDDLLSSGRDFGALVKSSFDGADDSQSVAAALAGRLGQGDTRWLLQAGIRRGHELKNWGETGGLGTKRDKPNPLAYTQRNLLVKLQHDLNAEHSLGLSGELFDRSSDSELLSEQGTGTSYEQGHNGFEKDSRRRAVLSYGFHAQASKAAIQNGEIKLYWQRSRHEGGNDGVRIPDARGARPPGSMFAYQYPYGPYGRGNSVKEMDYGLVSQSDGYLIAGSVQHHWSAGLDWSRNRNSQYSSGYDNCPATLPSGAFMGPRSCEFLHTNQADMPEVKGHQWSVWAQDEISWAQGRYALTPSLRFDAYRQSPQSGGDYAANPNADVTSLKDSSGQRVSPSLLAKYAPREDLSFYAKYGYGYKVPSASQLYLNYGAPGSYLRVGNPDLKPEVSHGYELGIEAGDAARGARLSFYDNRYRDYIDSVAIGPDSPNWDSAWAGVYPLGVTGTVNRARVRIYGVELEGHWDFDTHWYTRGSLAWTHGRDLDEDQYLNSVAPLKAILALGYRTPQWGAEAVSTLARRRTQVADPKADFQAPGYGVMDLNAWWTPAAVKGLRVQAGVFNVFDRKYWNALDVPDGNPSRPIDWYTQPGRSLRVSVSYQY